MTWILRCDRCGVEHDHEFRGRPPRRLPKGWRADTSPHVIYGTTYYEPIDLCPTCAGNATIGHRSCNSLLPVQHAQILARFVASLLLLAESGAWT